MNDTQSPLITVPDFTAWLAVARACHMCQKALAARLQPLDLEVAHYDVLANVFHEPGISQQVLARRLLVAKSNVSVLLAALERRGMVRRDDDPEDRRVRRVTLTDHGRVIALDAMARHADILGRMLGGFAPGEGEALKSTVEKVIAVLKTEPQPAMPFERDDAAGETPPA